MAAPLPDPDVARKAARLLHGPAVQRITIRAADDFDDLARRWRALEPHADGGFFLSWTFLGCLARTRFAGTRLLSVTQDGADVALALLGRRGGTTWLNETGTPALDSIFIEHNGLLHAPEAAPAVPAALRAARGRGRLVLSGVDEATLAASHGAGWVHLRQSRLAPSVALDRLDGAYLDTLSGNARAQIRRSMRLYGPELRLTRAASLAQALDMFDEMVGLHQTAWRARGRPGAFAVPHMIDFHRALIERAWGVAQLDLLRVAAGPRHIGTLYNFIWRGHVASYQSGFAYTDARAKPGLVCHALAIGHYAAAGARVYDFLAGADRYKLTLARRGQMLHWATLYPTISAPRVFWTLKAVAARAARRPALAAVES